MDYKTAKTIVSIILDMACEKCAKATLLAFAFEYPQFADLCTQAFEKRWPS